MCLEKGTENSNYTMSDNRVSSNTTTLTHHNIHGQNQTCWFVNLQRSCECLPDLFRQAISRINGNELNFEGSNFSFMLSLGKFVSGAWRGAWK